MLRTGAMALAAAGASTAAHAATVQITFNNSFVSTNSGVGTLVTDFGGDLNAELWSLAGGDAARIMGSARMLARAGSLRWQGKRYAHVGYQYLDDLTGPAIASLSGVVRLTVVDANVRGGSPNVGWLDMSATIGPFGIGRVDVHRFIFDDTGLGAPTGVGHADAAYPEYGAAVVPEPSGMGLLALGAGGLLARRRRAMAA